LIGPLVLFDNEVNCCQTPSCRWQRRSGGSPQSPSLADDRIDQILIRSVIDLAHGLGLQVVAEGVETEAR